MEKIAHLLVSIKIIGAGSLLYYVIVFALLTLCGIGSPIPEDIVLVTAGVFVYMKNAALAPMILVGLLGVISGDYLLFYIGRRWGLQFLSHKIFSNIFTEKRVAKVHNSFDKYGNKFVFFARFFWGLRAVTFFIAGTHTMTSAKFILFDGLGALISVPIIIYVSYRFGDSLEKAFAVVRQTNRMILLVIAAALIFLVIRHLFLNRKNSRK